MATLSLSIAQSFGMTMGPWGWAAYLAAAVFDNYVLGSMTPASEVSVGKANDLSIQTASQGAVIKKGYGTTQVTGNIIWGTKFTEHVHHESSGGKGGGGGSDVTTYSYSCSFAVMISEGPISKLVRVMADGNDFPLDDIDYRLYYGTEDQNPDDFMESIEGVGKVPAYRGMAYILFRNLPLKDYGNRIPTLTFLVTYPVNSLKSIVKEISTEAGLEETIDFTTEGLTDMTVDGYSRDGGTTFREQIQQLQAVKTFDAGERFGIVTFRTRDFNNVIPIPSGDIGAYENDRPSEPIDITRADEMDLPLSLSITYVSKDADYAQGQQTAKRLITSAKDEKSINTNIVLTDSAARAITEQKLMEAWEGRTTNNFTLPLKYGYVMPLDVLELTMPNGTGYKLVYVTKVQFGKPGLNVITGSDVHSSIYSLASRAVDGPIEDIITVAGPVNTNIMDIPKLPIDTNSSDDYVYLATGSVTNFGANVFNSPDSGATYTYVMSNDNNAVCGSSLSVLHDASPFVWDRSGSVIVNLDVGTLENHSKADLLNYANAAILGDEIIQFMSAELIDTDTYKLTVLLRARNGTEQYTGSHKIGERFVLLSSQKITVLPITNTYWYTQMLYKVGPRNESILGPDYQSINFVPQGIIKKPWAPCHLKTDRQDGTWTVSWTRRTRKDGAWKDYSDVPLSESQEIYEVEILSGTGGILKTFTTNTPKFSYAGDCAGANIYQISDVRGRGWPLEWRINNG